MKVVYSELHWQHQPSLRDPDPAAPPAELYFEQPTRIVAILKALDLLDSSHGDSDSVSNGSSKAKPSNHFELMSPREYEPQILRRILETIHSADYLDFLEKIFEAWHRTTGQPQFIPETFAVRSLFKRLPSRDVLSRSGFYCFDRFTPIVEGTYRAALASARCAITGADLLLEKRERAVYALCRPPGHHAAQDLYGGYCFLNNAAIAARRLIDQSAGSIARVAILDVDFHHGNGTQEIFYNSKEVAYYSLHGDPDTGSEPHFCGYPDEIGHGEGHGATLNVPLGGTVVDDETYLKALRQVTESIGQFQPDALVVSLGVDCYGMDPLSSPEWKLSLDCFSQMGSAVHARFAHLPILIVQEGGYHLEDLGKAVRGFLEPFATRG